jgi:hypothetical protein
MDWTIGVVGFDSRRGLGIFLFITASRTALGPTQPPIQWVPGALSLGVKRRGRETDHLHLVPRKRMRGAIPPIPQHVMAWCLVKQRDNFTFYPQSCGWVSASKLGPEIGQSSQGVYGFLQSLQANDGQYLNTSHDCHQHAFKITINNHPASCFSFFLTATQTHYLTGR